MPTKISAGVGDHPFFLIFITMIPIDCKITNFPYTCNYMWCVYMFIVGYTCTLSAHTSLSFYFTIVSEDVGKAKKLLCECYTHNRYVPPEDDWPPYHPRHYTPLTLVHHENRRTESEIIFVARTVSAQGNAISCKIYQKAIKTINDLFIPFESPEPLPFIILIEGAPGIGKTILSKEIALQWAEGIVLHSRQLLFLLYLRDPRVKSILNVQSLVEYFCQSDTLCKAITDWLIETSGEHLAIILDGYDEVSEDNKSHFIYNDLIGRKILVKCALVITSRPAASACLHNNVDCRAEVLGFAEEDRRDYIQNALQGAPDKIEQLEQF